MDEINIMLSETFYSNVDPRRKQELNDSRMIQEDQRAMSNLSEKEINKQFNAWKNVERLAMYNQSQKFNK
jgi:hypothetical protein